MLKRLVILAVLTACAGVMPGQPDKNPRPNQKPAKQEQPAVHSPNGKDNLPKPEQNQPKPSDNPPAGNAAIERPVWWSDPNWWLVVIAGCTGGVIGWQSWETRKAAEAAREAAVATRENTEMAINQGRAHLRIENVGLPALIPETGCSVDFTIKLLGPTQAFLTDFSVRMFASELEEDAAIPNASARMARIIIPEVITPEMGEVVVKGYFLEWLTRLHIGSIETMESWLYCEGVLRYKDTFGKAHHTKFKYVYSLLVDDADWFPCGGDKANERT